MTLDLLLDLDKVFKFNLGKLDIDEYVLGAIMIYTDVIGMFIKILEIVGKDSKKKK